MNADYIGSQLMAYPAWQPTHRNVDQPQPVNGNDWPISFSQRRAPDDDLLSALSVAVGGYGPGSYGPGADTSANPFEQIIDIVE
jgi:hypothetical protein